MEFCVLFESLCEATEIPCHCEPVRTLAWQSPSTFQKFGGDSHVGAYAPPRNDMRFWMVHQNDKLQFEIPYSL